MTIVALRPVGSRAALFCIHPIGGHVGEYRGLAERLGQDQPVYAIESRAIRAPETEHLSLDAMAADYAAQVLAACPGRALRLLGWSLGALAAHAIACELERRGAAVDRVGMIDPPPAEPVRADPALAAAMAVQIFHPSPPPSPAIRRQLRELDASEPSAIAAFCQARGLLPPGDEVARDAAGAIGLVPRHAALIAAHRPAVCWAPLHVWTPGGQWRRDRRDWSAHTSGVCTQREVGGTHYSMMRPPHVDAIVEDVASW